MQADPYVNLLINGNEFVQYATKTVIDPDLRICEFTDLLRGRFGTEGYAEHSAGERVASMAGALFVPIDVAHVGATFPVKLVTVNQDVADATPENITFTGGPARPLRVMNLVAIRDAGSNWQISGTGHEYEGEISFVLNVLDPGDLSLIRSIKTLPGLYNPALLNVTPGSSPATVYPEGAKYTPTGFTSNMVQGNQITIDPEVARADGYFTTSIDSDPLIIQATWTLDSDTSALEFNFPDSRFGFEDAGGTVYEIRITPPLTGAPVSKLEVAVGGSVVFTDDDGEASGTRYSVEFKLGTVRFYRNYTDEGSVPFYEHAGAPPVLPVDAHAKAAPRQTWRQIGYVTAGAGFVATYTAAEQDEDFGSAQTNLTVEVFQRRTLRGVVLDGHPVTITF